MEIKIKLLPGGKMPTKTHRTDAAWDCYARHDFCSKKCAGEWTNKQNLNCTCPICGKKFHVKQSRLAKMKLLACCSRECNKKYSIAAYT